MIFSELARETLKIIYCASHNGESFVQFSSGNAARLAAMYYKACFHDNQDKNYLPEISKNVDEVLDWIESVHLQAQLTGDDQLPSIFALVSAKKLFNGLNLHNPQRVWAIFNSKDELYRIEQLHHKLAYWIRAFRAEQMLPPDFPLQVSFPSNTTLQMVVDDVKIPDDAMFNLGVAILRCTHSGVKISFTVGRWFHFQDSAGCTKIMKTDDSNFTGKLFKVSFYRESITGFDNETCAFSVTLSNITTFEEA